jgi:hypothetical protein
LPDTIADIAEDDTTGTINMTESLGPGRYLWSPDRCAASPARKAAFCPFCPLFSTKLQKINKNIQK